MRSHAAHLSPTGFRSLCRHRRRSPLVQAINHGSFARRRPWCRRPHWRSLCVPPRGAGQGCASGGQARRCSAVQQRWKCVGEAAGRQPLPYVCSTSLSTCCLPGAATCRDPVKYASTLGGKKGVELVAGDVTDVQVRWTAGSGQLGADAPACNASSRAFWACCSQDLTHLMHTAARPLLKCARRLAAATACSAPAAVAAQRAAGCIGRHLCG